MGTVLSEDVYLVSKTTGEVVGDINEGESLSVRSVAQVENDKYWSQQVVITKKFTKMMHDMSGLAVKFTSNPMTLLALIVMAKYLVPNQNVLKKDGKKYKIVDLAKELGVSAQACGVHFKILKQANLIAEYKSKNGNVWAINPNFCMAGQTVPKNILKLFEKKA